MAITGKILFVINPAAGNNNNTNYREEISKFFADKDVEPEYFTLEKDQSPSLLKKAILKCNCNAVVAVGGDGTIKSVAAVLSETETPLGIIAGGSANGMAKELNIPDKLTAALEIIYEGNISTCDAIHINNKYYCLHLSDIGLNASLIKYFDESDKRGKLGYAKVVLKAFGDRKLMDVVIDTGKEKVSTTAIMVVIANASKYGTGAVINPVGSLNDGLFEVVVIHRLALRSVIKMMLSGKKFNPKHIEIFQATDVKIKTRSKVHFQVDGEYLGKTKNVAASIAPSSIRLILPEKIN